MLTVAMEYFGILIAITYFWSFLLLIELIKFRKCYNYISHLVPSLEVSFTVKIINAFK